MPKRTNLFQEVVEIIHRHMAEGATVEASGMLPSRSTGKLREVDVVIRGKQAGQEIIVSVEAVASARKANREWVDRMLGKHADLPTSKLVLVSERGFTKDAREAARAADAVPLSQEDLSSGDPDSDVVKAIPSLWPKHVTFSPKSLGVRFAEPAPDDGWEEDPPIVAIEEGVIGNLWQVVERFYKEDWLDLMQQLEVANIKEDEIRQTILTIEPKEGDTLQIGIQGGPRTLFLVNANGRRYALSWIRVEAEVEIKVSEVPLTHARLGEVDLRFGYGEGKVGDRDALLVVTQGDEGEGKLTLRFRPEKK